MEDSSFQRSKTALPPTAPLLNLLKTESFSVLNRSLVGIFILLLIVIIGEIGMYFFLQNNTISIAPVNQKQIQATKTLTKNISPINETTLNSLTKISSIGLVSSTINIEHEGKIVEISFTKGKFFVNKIKLKQDRNNYFKNGYYEYDLVLKIKRELDKETLDFYWDKTTLAKIKVFEKKGNRQYPIHFNDLKVGDQVTISVIIDLMNKNCIGYQCVKSYTIVKK